MNISCPNICVSLTIEKNVNFLNKVIILDALRTGLQLLLMIAAIVVFFGLIRIFVAKYFNEFYENAFKKLNNSFRKVFNKDK